LEQAGAYVVVQRQSLADYLREWRGQRRRCRAGTTRC